MKTRTCRHCGYPIVATWGKVYDPMYLRERTVLVERRCSPGCPRVRPLPEEVQPAPDVKAVADELRRCVDRAPERESAAIKRSILSVAADQLDVLDRLITLIGDPDKLRNDTVHMNTACDCTNCRNNRIARLLDDQANWIING